MTYKIVVSVCKVTGKSGFGIMDGEDLLGVVDTFSQASEAVSDLENYDEFLRDQSNNTDLVFYDDSDDFEVGTPCNCMEPE